jgi:hypothetical protein
MKCKQRDHTIALHARRGKSILTKTARPSEDPSAYFSRYAIGNDHSMDKPGFTSAGIGGWGHGTGPVSCPSDRAFVPAPSASLLSVGGSQGRRASGTDFVIDMVVSRLVSRTR